MIFELHFNSASWDLPYIRRLGAITTYACGPFLLILYGKKP